MWRTGLTPVTLDGYAYAREAGVESLGFAAWTGVQSLRRGGVTSIWDPCRLVGSVVERRMKEEVVEGTLVAVRCSGSWR